MTINLEMFCSGPDRPELAQPFSIGEWSYASNGHIMVRVPRREDVPENEADLPKKAPGLFPKAKPRFRRVPKLLPDDAELAVTTTEDCFECAGTGRGHPDCAACRCTCPDCDGEGTITTKTYAQVKVGKVPFCVLYISWMQSLPDLEIGPARRMTPLSFRFDGGEGLLMPVRA